VRMAAESYQPPSALSHFDPEELLGGLSTGIVVFDSQLYAIYANAVAQQILTFSLAGARGRRFGEIVGESNGLMFMLRRSLEEGSCCPTSEVMPWPTSVLVGVDVLELSTIVIAGDVTGPHLLLELRDATDGAANVTPQRPTWRLRRPA
jgi:nitrogen-specific signal transduction histidine kinase